MKNNNQAEEWIHSRVKFGPKPGLERMKKFMKKLGNPEDELRFIHIAGTNGKGSTVAYLSQLLQGLGLRVGTFTSPFIEVFNERISINGQFISDDDLNNLTEKIKPVVSELDKEDLGLVVEFEILTALSFLYFKEQNVDIVLMEVGLGGLYDSTNVIKPEISAVTSIGMDHMDILGSSLEEIARQKAGVIKHNIPLVIGKMPSKSVEEIFEKRCRELQSSIFRFNKEYQGKFVKEFTPWGEVFDFANQDIMIKNLITPLKGQHQIINASLALEIYYLFCQKNKYDFSEINIRTSMNKVFWPARMELIKQKPKIILDGAHNMEAVNQLVENMNTEFPDVKKRILFSALERKAIDGMLLKLKEIKNADIYITSFDFPKALDKNNHNFSDFIFIDDWKSLVEEFNTYQKMDEILLVTGSLYFVSEARKFIKKVNV